MSRAQDVHIHRQLHPDEVLITGNAKRHTPVWVEKEKLMRAWIEVHGIDEHRYNLSLIAKQNEQDHDQDHND